MRRARIAVALCVFTLIGLLLGAGGVLLPAQIDDYGVDKTTIGAVFVASSLGYLVSAIGSGPLVHRYGLRACLANGAAIALAASAGVAMRPSFGLFIALQGALGFGIGALEAGLNGYLSAFDRATSLLNLLHACFGVGALVGPVVAAAMLARGYRWTAFFGVIAVLIAPLLVGLVALYSRSGNGTSASAPSQPHGYAAAVRHPAVWLGGLFLICYVGVEVSVGNWAFSFLTEDRGTDVVLAGWVVSGYWLGLTAGRLVLGALAERVGIDAVALVGACIVGAVLCAAAVWLVPVAAIAGLALLGFCFGPMYPTMVSVMPRLVPAGLAATAIGIVVGVSVIGGAAFPWLAGTIAQRLGAWSLFPYTIVLAGLVGAVWSRIGRRLGASGRLVDGRHAMFSAGESPSN
jgi:fucose permease